MAEKKNEFTADLNRLFDQFVALSHNSGAIQWLLQRAIKQGRKTLSEWAASGKPRPARGILGVSTRLAVPDYAKPGPYLYRFMAGASHADWDERVLQLGEEMEKRVHRQILCNAFEATEKFLKIVAAKCHQYRREGKHKDHPMRLPFLKGEFHDAYPKWQQPKFRKRIGTPEYFRAYVAWSFRGGYAKFAKQLAAGLSYFHDDNDRRGWLLHLAEDYQLIEFCRHQSIHNDGEYTASQVHQFTPKRQAVLDKITATSVLTKAQTLLPGEKDLHRFIEQLAALALIVYRGLSDAFVMVDEYENA